jgi:Ca2+-binding RTX toxin-like protein
VVANGMNISGISSITGMEELDINSGSPQSITVGSGQLDAFGTIAAGSNPFTINAAAAGTYSLSGKTLGGTVTLSGSSGADTLTGSSASMTINGNAGADTIDANGGNDTLNGGTGNDTYKLSNTYGASTITDNDSTSGNSDLLAFGPGTADDQIWFTQSGNDLVAQIIGTSAKMTIKDWYLGSAHHVEQLTTSDGKTLTDAHVQNLVNAMSSLAVPTTTTLSPTYHTALDSTIAANWT